MSRVLTMGETMAMFSPGEIGSLKHSASVAVGVGGAESNVAIGLSRLGVPATWIGRVGSDSLGERVVREIRGEGVDVRVRVDSEAPTGLMLKERPTTGHTRVTYYRRGSAASRLQIADIRGVVSDEVVLVHLTGITPLLSDSAHDAVLHLLLEAKQHGSTVSLDINYRSALSDREQAGMVMRGLMEHADIVFGSVDEFALVAPEADSQDRVEVLARRFPTKELILKLGEGGAEAHCNGSVYSAPAHRVDVVDTVGAGDAFVAGYLAAFLDDAPVEERLALANACGAFACTAPGDWEAAPTRAEIEDFFRGNPDPVQR